MLAVRSAGSWHAGRTGAAPTRWDTARPMDWNDLRYFLALARHGSVRSAGAALEVSHSTVSRRIETLEEELGTRLFDRSRDGFALTDAGTRILARAERMEDEASGIERAVVGQDRRLVGRVAISCSDPYVSDVLLADLAPFCAEHPAISLSVDTEDRHMDLSRREADLAIRALRPGDQPPEYLVGRTVAPLIMASYVAVAHERTLDPALGATGSRWAGVEDVAAQRFLTQRSAYPDLQKWGSFASIEMLVQVAKHGLAVVMLPVYVGDALPTLRRIGGGDLGQVGDLWMLYHPDLRTTARVRAVRDCIRATFDRRAPLFEGRPPA